MRQTTPNKISTKPAFQKHPLAVAIHLACGAMLGAMPLAQAAPTGGAVVGGTGTISQSGTSTTINQAQGGRILLTASQRQDVFSKAVNTTSV